MAITHAQDHGQYSGASASVIVKMTSTAITNTMLAAFCLPANASVVSVNDSVGNRWIQDSYASNTNGGVELWHARGILGGTASVTAIFSAASVGTNISEWSSLWSQSPLDSWSQMFNTSASVTPQQVSPRTTGELAVIVGNSGASVNGAPSGWTALSVPGGTGFSAAYQILAGSVVPQSYWGASGASPWAAVEATFLPVNSTTVGAGTGGAFVNPNLQMPEISIQICESPNYQAPLQGTAIFTEIAPYVESISISGMGRSHLLDRVQSTQGTITVNGRDGTFNAWNTASFLYPYGLDPMTPVRCVGAWNGITSPVAFLYAQSFTPHIVDSQNVEVEIDCYDILQMLSLSYLSNNSYAQAVLAGN